MLAAAINRFPLLAYQAVLVRNYASSAVALVATLLVFFLIKYHVIASAPYSSYGATADTPTLLVRMIAVLAITCLCAGIRMRDLDVPVQRFFRVLLPVAAFYVFSAGIDQVSPDVPDANVIGGLIMLAWLAPVFAVFAWWRPAFLLPIVALIYWQKALLPTLYGYTVSPTDFMPLFDSILLMLVAVATLRGLAFSGLWQRAERERQAAGLMTPLMVVFLAMIAIHFSNYYHSGTAKIFLDGGPLSWVLENRTDMISHVTWEMGLLPLAMWPALAGLVTTVMVPPVIQIINLLTLLPQLLCPLVVFSRRLLIITLLFFDVQHIVIYLLTGIAFWKWVALNTAIVIALTRWERSRTPVPIALVMILLSTVVIFMPRIKLPGGYALTERHQAFFFTARLGWYDSPAANHTYLTAIMSDGRELRVPTNYLRSYSILMAQQRMAAFVGNLWPTGTWGSTAKYEIMKGGLACDLPLTPEPESYEKRDKFIRFIVARHAEALRLAGDDGRLWYDFYPHHIWSNPVHYREFAAADLREITSFRLTFEAICADWSGGERRTRLISQQHINIPLD